MSVKVDDLTIDISAKEGNAINSIEKLGDALRKLKGNLAGMDTSQLETLGYALESLGSKMSAISPKSVSKLTAIGTAFQALNDASQNVNFDAIKNLDFDSITNAFKKLGEPIKDVLKPLSDMNAVLVKVDSELKKKPKDTDGATKAIAKLNSETKKSTSGLSKFSSMLKRMIVLRGIRSGISAIINGMKEGLTNAYEFSKVVGYPLASALDKLASAGLKMKNQLGSALGEILIAIEPIAMKIINFVTTIADRLSRLFAMINGSDTYLQAQDVATQWNDASKGVKEYKRQLLGLDELNVLSSSGSGSGTAGTDYSQMFKEVNVDAGISKETLNALQKTAGVIKKTANLVKNLLTSEGFQALIGLVGDIISYTFMESLTFLDGLVTTLTGLHEMNISVIFDGLQDMSQSDFLKIIMPGNAWTIDAILKIKEENPHFWNEVKRNASKVIYDIGLDFLETMAGLLDNKFGELVFGTKMPEIVNDMLEKYKANEGKLKGAIDDVADTMPWAHEDIRPMSSQQNPNYIANYYGNGGAVAQSGQTEFIVGVKEDSPLTITRRKSADELTRNGLVQRTYARLN